MNTVSEFLSDISGITDTNILNVASAVITIGMVLVTLNFALGIVQYIFKPKL